jgi:quercetin dioxygenase-like cupin family protein
MTDSIPPKAMPGVSVRVLNKVDGPIEGYETMMVELQIPAGTLVGRHSHPGIGDR